MTATIFNELLGAEVVALHASPSLAFVDQLYADELKLVERAVEARRAQFATARALARRALEQLGIAPQSLLPGDDRCPRWPEGIVGSITHTNSYCAVAVARASDVVSIGIDAEDSGPLGIDIIGQVCSDAERRWVESFDRAERDAMVKLVFSAKEAFYKCQYPLSQTYLGFRDVEIDFDMKSCRFEVRLSRGLQPEHRHVAGATGGFHLGPARTMCAVRLSRTAAP